MSESRQAAPYAAVPPTIQINGITFRDGFAQPPFCLSGPDMLMWCCPELTRAEAEGLARISDGRVSRYVPDVRNHITNNLPALREKMKREAEEAALPPKPPAYEVVAMNGIMAVEDGKCTACGNEGPVVWADTSYDGESSVSACAECIGKAFARWAGRKAT